jgi:hypothetical protein
MIDRHARSVFAALFLTAAAGSSSIFASDADEVRDLRQKLEAQQHQIDELRSALEDQRKLLDRLAPVPAKQALVAAPSVSPAPAQTQPALPEAKSVAGFRFSGDFRYRFDAQLRSANAAAGPLQNLRNRYRIRMNVDKDLDPRFRFHLQLSTGPYNVGTTNDQDWSATVAKHPFSIAEAYVDVHPNPRFSLRAGRMEEVFADNMRFLWDDDVRFNGVHQILNIPVTGSFIKSVEFRMGEYILNNPNVPVLGATSPYVAAGYAPGQHLRDSALVHPGAVIRGDLGAGWTQQITGGVELYRNPNQIQLASTANGFPVVVSNPIGVQLPGPMSAAGNATTTPGGAQYFAASFKVAHLGYRMERKIGAGELPAWLDFQVSRNVGTGALRDAFMASANLGAVRKRGDMRFLYQYALKDANSMISQFTDDDLGTGTGVNIAVHALRFDLGLTRFLQWQNLLFLQNARRANDPDAGFFVVLPRSANTTIRYLGHLAFSF